MTEAIELSFEGTLDIERAREVYQKVEQALASGPELRVDMGGVEDVDLSFLQIVCAALKEADKQGKQVLFSSVPEEIRRKAAKMGFTREHTGGFFWEGGAHAQKDYDG